MVNTINGLAAAVIAFVILAVVLGIGGTILDNIGEQQCNSAGGYWNTTSPNTGTCEENASDGGGIRITDSIAFNATYDGGLEGVETFADWLPTIAVILAAALIIGLVTAYFYMRS